MTKEVEVGDEFTGKVVKTTTFGAFVELAKGTDGLLHISNVSPGKRVDTVEDVLNKGDEIDVRVVEVDRERGRIGLRLAEDPDDRRQVRRGAGPVGAGGGGGGSGGGPRRDRGGGPRRPRRPRPRARRRRRAAGDRDRRARLRAARGTARDRDPRPAADDHAEGRAREHRLTELDSGVRVVTERDALRALRRPRVLDRHGLGCRGRARGRALSHLHRAHAVPRHGALRVAGDRPALRRHGRRAQRRARARRRRRSTRACSTCHLERAFDVMADMVWRPRIDGDELDAGARDRARGDRDVRGRPAGQGLRRARRGRLRRASARAGDHRHAPRSSGTPAASALRAFHAARYVAGERRRRGGRLGRPRRARRARPGAPGDRRRRPRARAAARRPTAAAARRRFFAKETEQYHVCLGAPGIARDDERRFALRVLDNILGGTSSSRLFQEVREKRGLAYRVYSFQRSTPGTGQVGLYVGTRPDNVATRDGASSADELERFRDEPVTAEELDARQGERQGPRRARRSSRRRRA